MTGTVNPEDATRKEIMTRTVKMITICVITRKNESEGTTTMKTSVMQLVPKSDCKYVGHSLK